MSSGRDHPVGEQLAPDPVDHRAPVRRVEEDDREVPDLAGLDQRQRLVQLVERAEPAREDDEALRRPHEADLAGVEVVERVRRCRGTGSGCCSCGSSMLKPTEQPPPSCAPRFAPSITPPPPPVTTAQPASPKRRPTARAASYGLLPSATRAEPKSATAGRGRSRATFSNPARNSAAIFATDALDVARCRWSRIWRSSTSQAVLRDVRRATCRARARARSRSRARR